MEVTLPDTIQKASLSLQKPRWDQMGEFEFSLLFRSNTEEFARLTEACLSGTRILVDGLPCILNAVGEVKKRPVTISIDGVFAPSIAGADMNAICIWINAVVKRSAQSQVFTS